MKVGEYVRTKSCNVPSLIGKIIKTEYITPCNANHGYIYLIDTKEELWFEEDDIIKSSPNIIDLIEVGDYVDGLKVVEVRKHLHDNIEIVLTNGKFTWSFAKNDADYDIKSIVTKEQFEAMQYKVGE